MNDTKKIISVEIKFRTIICDRKSIKWILFPLINLGFKLCQFSLNMVKFVKSAPSLVKLKGLSSDRTGRVNGRFERGW